MLTTKIFLAAIAAACVLGAPSTASAAPALAIDASTLPPHTRTALRDDIARARAADPASFGAVRDVVVRARELDRRARGRKAPIALHLAALGPKALLPLLELAAFEAPALAPDGDRAALRRDVVEAIGLLHDARAMPVLTALLDRDGDLEMTRTAAEAIGRLESTDAASTLTAALGKATGERATAIAAGMGACHRASIAKALADRLAARPDEATAKVLARALGHAGNAWAWKTVAARDEETAARAIAARALVAAYVGYRGEAHEAASKALLVVDAPGTPSLLEAARKAAPDDATARALDELADRFTHNPTRVTR